MVYKVTLRENNNILIILMQLHKKQKYRDSNIETDNDKNHDKIHILFLLNIYATVFKNLCTLVLFVIIKNKYYN
jgi:hypothetical protein